MNVRQYKLWKARKKQVQVTEHLKSKQIVQFEILLIIQKIDENRCKQKIYKLIIFIHVYILMHLPLFTCFNEKIVLLSCIFEIPVMLVLKY